MYLRQAQARCKYGSCAGGAFTYDKPGLAVSTTAVVEEIFTYDKPGLAVRANVRPLRGAVVEEFFCLPYAWARCNSNFSAAAWGCVGKICVMQICTGCVGRVGIASAVLRTSPQACEGVKFGRCAGLVNSLHLLWVMRAEKSVFDTLVGTW